MTQAALSDLIRMQVTRSLQPNSVRSRAVRLRRPAHPLGERPWIRKKLSPSSTVTPASDSSPTSSGL